jgi:hypothetical protein
MYAKSNDIETAKKAYGQVIESFPESPYSTLARTKLIDPTNTDELPLEAAPEITPVVIQPEVSEVSEEIMTPTPDDTVGFQLPPESSDEPVDLDSLNSAVPDNIEQ